MLATTAFRLYMWMFLLVLIDLALRGPEVTAGELPAGA
jgi:hypothetical protein